jgi:hypothetical protein
VKERIIEINMSQVIASLKFMKYNASKTLANARGVFIGLTGNTGFGTLPAGALALLDTSIDKLEEDIGNTQTGGLAETAIQEAQRVLVNNQLHKLAIFCQENCNNDPTVFLTSGFKLAHTTNTHSPLPKCVIQSVTNGASTQLVVVAAPMTNATGWEAQVWVGTNPPKHADCLKPTRKMTLINLTPGTLVNIQMRALGGSTGFSDWSDVVQHMCM